ncbi:hypothetical protein AAFN86_02500 [Roseomonas sp. CAU 1739]|uniref:hypothetical protein n=1 Tax=Roseomonas sp. CAU 1739 TaxID=3140364 RepID=UPI00325B7A44
MNGPPPDAVILSITGLQGPADAAAVEAALRRGDPAVRLWTDWPRGLVAVQSAAPAKALCAAVQGAGFGVLVRGGAGAGRGSIAGIFGRMLLYAVLGAVAGLLLGIGLGLANSMFNPDCTRPGSSGGCAIGVGIFGLLFGCIGVPVGAVVGLIHGLVRRHG